MADTDIDDEGNQTPDSTDDERRRQNDKEGWVPLSRAERMAENAARREREAAEKRIAELEKRQTQSSETREYTRAELQKFVDDGRISQDDANAIYDKQIEARAERRALQAVEQRLSQHDRTSTVLSQIERYKALIPELADEDSDTARKVAREFRSLVDLGEPEHVEDGGHRTELLALRTLFGPVESLQRSRTDKQTHQETDAHGDHGDDSDGPVTKDGWPKGLTERQRAYYQKQIDAGIYKSREDIVKLHERVSKRRTARA